MQVLIPQKLEILNDSVPENDAPEWNVLTVYKAGARVIYRGFVYEAMSDNSGKNPLENSDFLNAPWWTIGPTNKTACIYDIYAHTQTIAPDANPLVIQVPIRPPATGIALLNMTAVRVTVSVESGDGELMYGGDTIYLLRDSEDWWDYCFGEFIFRHDITFLEVPPVMGTVTIVLEHGTAAAVGMIIVGERAILGDTQYGARSGIIDYSSNTTDAYGNEVFVKRQTARRIEASAWIDDERADHVASILRNIASVPVLWIADNNAGHESLVAMGVFRDGSITYSTWGHTILDIEIRGAK